MYVEVHNKTFKLLPSLVMVECFAGDIGGLLFVPDF
jgi:hypothetical protein